MRLAVPLLLPLLLAILLVGGAVGEDGKQGKATALNQFMEEMRGALASQWDLLQNLRYHTLSIKVRLIQLEAQLQSLSEHLDTVGGSEDADTHRSREKESCGENGIGTDGANEAEDAEEIEGEDDMQDLLEAMRNLTQVYSTLAASNRLCGRTDLESDGEASSGPVATTTITTPPTERKDGQQKGKGEKEDAGNIERNPELSHNTNVTAQLGSTVVLNCRLDRLQDPEQAVWIRARDQNWLSQGRHKVAANEGRISVAFSDEDLNYYRLYLEDVRHEDEGAYECYLSTNLAGSQIIWLTVLDPTPSPPQLKQSPSDKLALEDQDVTLTCRASGYPKPSITWTRNSLQISSSARHQITPAGDLIIRGVRRGDAGRYVCQGVNSKGRVEGAALLTVRQPTRIQRPPRDKERLVGDNIVFRCRAKGDEGTPLLVEWLKDGVTINFSSDATDSRFSRLPNNALEVNFAQVDDSGMYTCRASTPFDVASASATLIVREATTTTTTSTTTTAATAATLHPVLQLDYCPPPFERIQKYVCVLEITHMKVNWEDAAEYCRMEGGQLAWENEGKRVLQDFLERRYGLGLSTKSANTRWPFWVGGRENDGGEWHWLDGSPVSAGMWAPQHRRPSGRRAEKEDWCLMLDGYQSYLATALPCHSKRYFLCRLK